MDTMEQNFSLICRKFTKFLNSELKNAGITPAELSYLSYLLEQNGMTQDELAARLFVTRQAVSAWETEKALPDVDTLEGIASALDAEVTEVIYGVSQARDLKRMKRRWALIGGIIVIILAIIYIILNITY